MVTPGLKVRLLYLLLRGMPSTSQGKAQSLQTDLRPCDNEGNESAGDRAQRNCKGQCETLHGPLQERTRAEQRADTMRTASRHDANSEPTRCEQATAVRADWVHAAVHRQ
eukprot:4334433-Pleurochrysis_carterae.AAC.1